MPKTHWPDYAENASSLLACLCRKRHGLITPEDDNHYGTSILAARPRSPRDKATAESAVQVVTRWILALLRHQRFEIVDQVDAAIAALLPSLNDRPFQKLPGSRASVFVELDRPALMALPRTGYELARFKTVKVHIDCHVEVDGHRYSVPQALVSSRNSRLRVFFVDRFRPRSACFIVAHHGA